MVTSMVMDAVPRATTVPLTESTHMDNERLTMPGDPTFPAA